jgi:hypothetical protein
MRGLEQFFNPGNTKLCYYDTHTHVHMHHMHMQRCVMTVKGEMTNFCTFPETATSNITTDLLFVTLKCNNFKKKSGE